MSAPRHTPGPWVVVPPDREHPSRAMVGAGGGDIYDAPLTRETEANARLIAAAPELADALERMLDRYGHHPDDVHEPKHCVECAARAVLRKAGVLPQEPNP